MSNCFCERGCFWARKISSFISYCWRSKTPIIFRNVDQFFIRIDALRGRAIEAIHNEVKWIPAWAKTASRERLNRDPTG